MGNLGVPAESRSKFALSKQGRVFVVAFWEFAAFLANSFVFLLIGLALADMPVRSLSALAAAIGLALLGRAAAVYPVSLFSRARVGRLTWLSSISCGGQGCGARWRWRSPSRYHQRRPTATNPRRGVRRGRLLGFGPSIDCRRVLTALSLDRADRDQ